MTSASVRSAKVSAKAVRCSTVTGGGLGTASWANRRRRYSLRESPKQAGAGVERCYYVVWDVANKDIRHVLRLQ